jgi:hypothetical protein
MYTDYDMPEGVGYCGECAFGEAREEGEFYENLLTGIHQEIIRQTKEKVSDTIERYEENQTNYNNVVNENRTSKNTITELERTIRSLEYRVENEEKKYKKDIRAAKNTKALVYLESLFKDVNIKDYVWFLSKKRWDFVKCPHCNGAKTIPVETKDGKIVQLPCDYCHRSYRYSNEGTIQLDVHNSYILEKVWVRDLYIKPDGKNGVRAYVKHGDGTLSLDGCYLTEVDGKSELDKVNVKIFKNQKEYVEKQYARWLEKGKSA